MPQVHLNEDQSAIVRRAFEHVDVCDANGETIARIAQHPADWVDRWMEWHGGPVDAGLRNSWTY